MSALSLIGFTRYDPCARWIDGSFWLAARTPHGPGSIRLHPQVEAHGPGGPWLLERAPGMLGELDDVTGFAPEHPLLKRLKPVTLPRTGLVFPRLMRAICEQKVTGKEAYQAYSAIVRHFREEAPGPVAGLLLPPSPEAILGTPYWGFHALGLEQRRAEVLRRAAFEAPRLESCVDSAALAKRLLSIPGIGPWTVAEVTRLVFGDADAVSVGDFHMKNFVSWALAGEPRGTDERMLELLQPYAGHRGRVCLMIESAGLGAPRYGPRAPIRNFRSF
ncbi:3-methyladenine DNA glycosylase [Rhizocola hellebori]|uniref:3-methyladenine DNA glycosylase n=1 Tax=Rhizocola hellebori TaxID=1392758 RepID=A0A8J3VG30_9ACTN|nr:DNA-3-methyladenine glycosylase 2 family protein [Rhizocola hellebori]GIH04692.1 3-methyladenine DNA glycosylase [Rhizocola hellebori]